MMLAIWSTDKRYFLDICTVRQSLTALCCGRAAEVDYFRPQNHIDYLVFFEV